MARNLADFATISDGDITIDVAQDNDRTMSIRLRRGLITDVNSLLYCVVRNCNGLQLKVENTVGVKQN